MADARNQELYCTKLIRLIEQNKCLYDTSLTDYAVKSTQEDAWAKVADELRSSVSECKDRWRNIRNAYLRHIRNNIRSESGAKAKKSYYLSNYLNFLTPFLKSRTHSSYFIVDENQSEYDATNDIQDGHFLKDHINNDIIPCEDIKVEPDYFDSPGEGTQVPYYYDPGKKRKMDTDNYDHDDGCISIGRSDPDLDFLKSLVPDFRLLSAAQKRKVKIGILKLIDDELSSP